MTAPDAVNPGRRFSPSRTDMAFVASVLGASLMLLWVYGFWPGSSQVPVTAFRAAGSIECLHDQGFSSLWRWCDAVGVPVGKPFLTGEPQIRLGWLIRYIPGVDAWAAHDISSAMFVVAGLLGGVCCALRWTGMRWIALLSAVLYLLSPSVVQLNGFEQTFHGFIILPAVVAVGLHAMDRLEDGRWLTALAALLTAALVAVFMDGYSFFGAGLAVGTLALVRAGHTFRNTPAHRHRAVGLVFAVGGAWAIAAFTYTMYVPANAYEHHVSGIEVFRYFGVDLATLVIPTPSLLYPRLLGWDVGVPPLWGDYHSITSNYLGFSVLGLLLWLVIIGRRRLAVHVQVEVAAILLAGLVALGLSFGPALKVYSVARDIAPEWAVAPEHVTLSLPLDWLYTLPGISEMRATFRWATVTRFAATMGVGVALAALLRPRTGRGHHKEEPGLRPSRRRAALVVLLAVLVTAETVANIPQEMTARTRSDQLASERRNTLLAEADELLRDGELVLVLPTVNDFLADAMVPMADVRSYNVGGDKNYFLARDSWPASVRHLVDAYDRGDLGVLADSVCATLATDADAVVLAVDTLHHLALIRPDRPEARAYWAVRHDVITSDPRFEVRPSVWITVVRAADGRCA